MKRSRSAYAIMQFSFPEDPNTKIDYDVADNRPVSAPPILFSNAVNQPISIAGDSDDEVHSELEYGSIPDEDVEDPLVELPVEESTNTVVSVALSDQEDMKEDLVEIQAPFPSSAADVFKKDQPKKLQPVKKISVSLAPTIKPTKPKRRRNKSPKAAPAIEYIEAVESKTFLTTAFDMYAAVRELGTQVVNTIPRVDPKTYQAGLNLASLAAVNWIALRAGEEWVDYEQLLYDTRSRFSTNAISVGLGIVGFNTLCVYASQKLKL